MGNTRACNAYIFYRVIGTRVNQTCDDCILSNSSLYSIVINIISVFDEYNII